MTLSVPALDEVALPQFRVFVDLLAQFPPESQVEILVVATLELSDLMCNMGVSN